MDTETARTFVTVAEAGSFLAAAERLNVTQSTVSARIKNLEAQLGRRLLDRDRRGARPTAAGRQFLRHAAVLVRIWRQAQQELSLPETTTHVLGIGAQVSLWDGLLGEWIGWMRHRHPDIALRTDVASADILMRQVVDGTLDIAVVYTPQSAPGLVIQPLFDEVLIMVTDQPGYPPEPGVDYVFCDWGLEFRTSHAIAFPDADAPVLTFGAGAMGLPYILRHGGAGYFPRRLAEPHIADGSLFVVAGAPIFQRPAFVVHPRQAATHPLHVAVEALLKLAPATQGL